MDMLFNIAKAQGADEVASPTIPFSPPFSGTTPSVSAGVQGPSIVLETDKTSLKPGEKAKITVRINTRGRDIKSFSFRITYNANIFTITDADPNTPGTQIKYNDQFFLLETNTVSGSGASATISVKASTTQGSTTITDRIVAEFEATAIAEGFSNFEITRNGSLLVNLNSVDILESVSGVSLTASNQAAVTTTLPVGPTSPIKTSTTPNTALSDDIGGFSAIIIGGLCLAAGFYLWNSKKNAPKSK